MRSRILRNIDVILVLFLFTLSGSGIRWGLPGSDRSEMYGTNMSRLVGSSEERLFVTGPLQSYQVDECSTLLPLARMNPRRFDFDPGWFHWGTLYPYLVGGMLGLLSTAGVVTLTPDRLFYINNPDELARIYLAARGLTWIFGLGCVILFLILLRRRSPSAVFRLLFGILFIAAPLFVLYTHFATPDVCMLFWFLLALLLAGTGERRPSHLKLLLSFAAAGLAASTKYYGILAMGFPLVISFQSRELSVILKGILITAAGFLLGTPYALFNWRGFLNDIQWQMNHIQTGHGDIFLGTRQSFLHHLLETFPAGISSITTIFIVLTFIFALVLLRRIPSLSIVLVILVLWFQLSRSPLKFSRYALPLIPLHLIVGMEVLHVVWHRSVLRGVLIGLICTGILAGVVTSSRHIRILTAEDVRDKAGEWFTRNAEQGDTVLLPGRPYFATPPLNGKRFDIIVGTFGADSIMEMDPRWIIISDYDAEPWLRAPELRPTQAEAFHYIRSGLPFPDTARYITHEFRSWNWGTGFPGSGTMLPHDLRYHCPTVWIFERKDI